VNARGTPRHRAWRSWVRDSADAAQGGWATANADISVEILYIWVDAHCDIDNLIKPVLDELQYAGVYWNDRQILDLRAERVDRWGRMELGEIDPDVVNALATKDDFLLIRVRAHA